MVGGLPAGVDTKLSLLGGKVRPMALYGSEAAPAAAGPLRTLRARMATSLDTRAARSRRAV
eukprot:9997805-Alexandrium_andersonii.AAC.1